MEARNTSWISYHYTGTLYRDNNHNGAYGAGDKLLPDGLFVQVIRVVEADDDLYQYGTVIAQGYTSGNSEYDVLVWDYYYDSNYYYYLAAPLVPSDCSGYLPNKYQVYFNMNVNRNFGAQPN